MIMFNILFGNAGLSLNVNGISASSAAYGTGASILVDDGIIMPSKNKYHFMTCYTET